MTFNEAINYVEPASKEVRFISKYDCTCSNHLNIQLLRMYMLKVQPSPKSHKLIINVYFPFYCRHVRATNIYVLHNYGEQDKIDTILGYILPFMN